MGAALGFINDFLEESHVVSTHGELIDPAIGELLAFGKAVDIENKSTRLLDIAAFASGPVGADLRVAAVTDRVFGVGGVKGVGIGVPRVFEGGEVVYSWGSAIRQIVFAGEVGGSAKCECVLDGWGCCSRIDLLLTLFLFRCSDSGCENCGQYDNITADEAAVATCWPVSSVFGEALGGC